MNNNPRDSSMTSGLHGSTRRLDPYSSTEVITIGIDEQCDKTHCDKTQI